MVRRPNLPKLQLPGRKAKDDSEAKTKEAKAEKKPAAKKTAATASASKDSAASKKPSAKTPAAKTPAPNIAERMEGLQGWMAEIERKQGRMTYFGAAAAGVAILASAGALYLGVTNQQDSADKDDFEALEQRVTDVGDSLKSSTEEQLKALDDRMRTVEQRLDGIEQKQTQTDTTLEALQKQVNQQATQGAGAGAGTTTPGAAPTTPPANP
jgi:hypothetical protein